MIRKKTLTFLPVIRQNSLSAMFAASIYLALGLFLLFAPSISRKLLCMIVGGGTTLYGLFLLGACLLHRQESLYRPEILLSACALAFGLFALLRPVFLMDFLFTVLGVIIMIAGISSMLRALCLRALSLPAWKPVMIISCAISLAALTAVLFPSLFGRGLAMGLGAFLSIQSVCDLYSIHLLRTYPARKNNENSPENPQEEKNENF